MIASAHRSQRAPEETDPSITALDGAHPDASPPYDDDDDGDDGTNKGDNPTDRPPSRGRAPTAKVAFSK